MLRHFDQIGLLSPYLSDNTTGYRFYSAQQKSQVRTIVTLQKFGFSLKEIQSLTQSKITVEAFLGLLKNREALLRNSVDEGVSQLLRIKECIDILSKNHNSRIENETPLNPSSYILDLKDPDFTLEYVQEERKTAMPLNNNSSIFSTITSSPNESNAVTLSSISNYNYQDFNLNKALIHLPSNAQFFELCEELLLRSELENLCFITLDLDNFMHVNDQYGYAMGDQVIHVFYLIIEQVFSPFFHEHRGFIGRLGGDEYAVIIYNTPFEDIDNALQTIVSSINEYTFLHENKAFHVSTLCGGYYVDEKLIKDSMELISQKSITSDNFTQHLRHESTKVLIDVKRAGRNGKQIKVHH